MTIQVETGEDTTNIKKNGCSTSKYSNEIDCPNCGCSFIFKEMEVIYVAEIRLDVQQKDGCFCIFYYTYDDKYYKASESEHKYVILCQECDYRIVNKTLPHIVQKRARERGVRLIYKDSMIDPNDLDYTEFSKKRGILFKTEKKFYGVIIDEDYDNGSPLIYPIKKSNETYNYQKIDRYFWCFGCLPLYCCDISI